VRLPQNLLRLLKALDISPQRFIRNAVEAYITDYPYVTALCNPDMAPAVDVRDALESHARKVWHARHSNATLREFQSLRSFPVTALRDDEMIPD
jgi:hypothetical protein